MLWQPSTTFTVEEFSAASITHIFFWKSSGCVFSSGRPGIKYSHHICTAVDWTDLQQLGYWHKYEEEPDIVLSTFPIQSNNWSLSESLQHLHKSFSGAEPNMHMNILKWLQWRLLKASFKFKVNKPWRELRLPGYKFTLRIGHDHLAGAFVGRSVIINESKNADNVKPAKRFCKYNIFEPVWESMIRALCGTVLGFISVVTKVLKTVRNGLILTKTSRSNLIGWLSSTTVKAQRFYPYWKQTSVSSCHRETPSTILFHQKIMLKFWLTLMRNMNESKLIWIIVHNKINNMHVQNR